MARLIFVNRFYAPDQSATARVLTQLAEGLAGEGVPVTVIASRMRYDGQGDRLAARENLNGVEVFRVATSRFGRGRLVGRLLDYLSFYPSAAWRVWRYCRRGDVVVAKTDPPLLGVALLLPVWLRRAHLVQWLQDVFPEVAHRLGVRGVSGVLFRLLKALRNLSLRQSRVIVVIGRRMADLMRAEVPRQARVELIPNWTDTGALTPLARDRNPLRQELGFGGEFIVGYAGNLGRAHEVDTFLAAGSALAAEPDIAWLWTGGGHGYERLRDRGAGIGNWHFSGYQPAARLRESLAVPDVHLVCLRPEVEGLIVPSKVYGVLAVGRPVVFVGDPDGEVARLLADNDCGVTVAPGQGEALATCLLALRDDAARYQRLADNARDFAVREADFERAMTAWRALYRNIAGVPVA